MQSTRRLAELDKLIGSVYEDKVLGKIPEEVCINLLKKYKLRALFNLIPFNPWPGCAFEPSDKKTIEEFSKTLDKAGFAAPVRVARGQDILAACGQLKSKKEKDKNKS